MPEFTSRTDSKMSNIIFNPDFGQHKLQQLNVKSLLALIKCTSMY